MNRRKFFGAVGSAGALAVLPSTNVLGNVTNDDFWIEEGSMVYSFSSDPTDYSYAGVPSKLWKGRILSSFLTSYTWPQDRPVVLETPAHNPRYEGDMDTLCLLTFDLNDMPDFKPDHVEYSIWGLNGIWQQVDNALRFAYESSSKEFDNWKYCSLVNIAGLESEFATVCCARPVRPRVNHWNDHLARRKFNSSKHKTS